MKARLGCRGVLETRFPRMWLSLTSDKMKVEATNEKESELTLFYLIPTGMREVCIQHIASKHFIAINHNGKLISKSIYDVDCNFKEGIFANYWTTYSSLKWGLDRMQLTTWFMAINGRGHRVSAKITQKSRPSAHFLPDPIEGNLHWRRFRFDISYSQTFSRIETKI